MQEYKKHALDRHERRDIHSKAVLAYGTSAERLNVEIKSQRKETDLIKLMEFYNLKIEDKPLLPLFQSVYFCVKMI